MTTCHDIQLWWELPSIAHFCSLFRAAFGLLDFDIEDLEEAILTDGLDGSASPLLVELLVRLLQGCMPGRTVTPSNIDSCIRKLFRQKCQEDPSWRKLRVEGDFRTLNLRRKVEVLHTLCDMRLEAEDVIELLKNLETESLRVEPLGYDDSGSTYWYFYGTRLYREDHSIYHPLKRKPKDKEDKKKHKSAKSVWQVECFTEEDWRNLARRFEGCDSRLERGLFQTLKDDFLPEIPRLFEEKEKRRMLESAPRRTSGRVQKLKEKKEEEERRLAVELIEHEKRRIQEEEKKRIEDKDPVEDFKDELKIEEDSIIDEDTLLEEELLKMTPESPKPPKREKKKRKAENHTKEKDSTRLNSWEEDVLQERFLTTPPTSPVNRATKRKDQKSHKSSKRHKVRHVAEEEVPASDTSNKENNCGIDVLSDECAEYGQDETKPKVFSGRKTNNSLSSLAFSLTPSNVVPETAPQMVNPVSTKKKVKSNMLMQTEEELRTGMYKILEQLGDHEDGWPFLDPVDDKFAPNYYAVIRRPMYISRMEQRLDSGYYTCLSMFESDFKLMMDNCKLYNGPESEYTHMAFRLEKVFARLKDKYLVTESDDEMYIDMSFQDLSQRKKKRVIEEGIIESEKSEKPEKKKRGRKKKKVGRKRKREEVEDISIEQPAKKRGRKKKKVVEIETVEIPSDAAEVDVLYKTEDMVALEADLRTNSEEDTTHVQVSPKKDWKKERLKSESETEQTVSADKILKSKKRHKSNMKKKKNKKDAVNDVDNAVCDDSVDNKLTDSDASDQEAVFLYYNNEPDNETDDERQKIFHKDHDLLMEDNHHSDAEEKKDKDKSSPKKHSKKHKSPEKSHKHHHHHHHHHHKSKPKHHHHKKKHVDSSPKKPESPVYPEEQVPEYPEFTQEENEEELSSEIPVKEKHKSHSKENKTHKESKSHIKESKPHSKESKSHSKETKPHSKDSKSHSKESKPNAKESKPHSKESKPHSKESKSNSKESKPHSKESKQHSKESSHKKKKKHDKHHKDEKHKNSKHKKGSKKKKLSADKMDAIAALDQVTEQTLKDINSLLDDPDVPKFSTVETFPPSPENKTQEYDDSALNIEAEYIKKLQTSEKKSRKKKKKEEGKKDGAEGSGTKARTKIRKEKKPEEAEKSDGSLDNVKELFKDIKDGRIKPGAIIKSKDIAKKEGQVKKDNTKTADGKSKGKNPFGKINKQENSKLTTLIAKAKESRIGLVPNNEVGDSPKLSLGSIIPFSMVRSTREPNTDDELEKQSDKNERDSRLTEPKDDSSHPQSEEEEDIQQEPVVEDPPVLEEIPPPPTPRGIWQEKATPNLSAWFKAFGGPKASPSSKKINERLDDEEEVDVDGDDNEESNEGELKIQSQDETKEDPPKSPSIPEEPPASPRPPSRHSSPEHLLSPGKPETPWFHSKMEEKDEEPIWKKNKSEEDEDPYKFEEEELDRAREEAKKLEVERQRKASVSSSGLSDPSPLNIDSGSPAFSSEGERSPMTKQSPMTRSPMTQSPMTRSPMTQSHMTTSPATRSPMTPFGSSKFSPVEKSPGVSYSPRYEMSKGFSSYDEKKYQNGPLKAGFYQDMSEKQQEKDSKDKQKESQMYSPTVPYVSPFYSKDSGMAKQKSPGRYTIYSSVDSMDKPKTPGYFSASAPSTPSDRPSPSTAPEEKQGQCNYYNYDPTKSLTDQYKNTGSSSKPYVSSDSQHSPHVPIASPPQPSIQSIKSPDKPPDMQPPKKRQIIHKTSQSPNECNRNGWDKNDNVDKHRSDPYHHPLTANLANLSQIVSRIPEPHSNPYKSGSMDQNENPSKAVQNTRSINDIHPVMDLPLLSPSAQMSNASKDNANQAALQPPAAHQKSNEDRPVSRNVTHHSNDKPLSHLHQKTMWTSSLPSSIASSLSSSLPSSLSSLVSSATMPPFALGQKGFNISSEHLAQFGMDRAALASFAGRSGQNSNLFSHELLQRSSNQSSNSNNSSNLNLGQNSSNNSHRNTSTTSNNANSGTNSTSPNNFELGLARSYASMMGAASQTSPLFVRGNELARLSGASSPFLPQSPGLGLGMGSRTPTPAHQQSNFAPSIARDPITQSHPSLQIPSLNSISSSQASLSHLNAANLGYTSRDSLALMNQGGRGALAANLVDPASQQLYTQYFQRHQQLAQEELLLRSAGAGQLAAQQSMMLQHGLMSAAAGYPSGYPHSLGLRSGSYQGMNRPWI